MQIGIVGLPFSGKTTLFQTLTRLHLDDAMARRQQTNMATVKVPDERVDRLGEFFHPKKLVYTSIEFVDVVGLNKGDRESTQFTNTFLASVKTNDALLHVVRVFDDPLAPHPEGSIDPVRDITILENEFLLSDMAMVETRLDKLRKQVMRAAADDRSKAELVVLEKCAAWLEQEKPLRLLELDPAQKKIIRGFQFLSEKPLLILLNLADDAIDRMATLTAEVQAAIQNAGILVDAFVGKIEMELAMLPDEDAETFMADYGIRESALKRIIQSAYRLLGLISFLTAGDDECRAWTIKAGTNAQEAAGAIHTDLMNRFIRAEVVHFNDFVALGSMAACKEKGHWRLEGREYIVLDGDILTIRHG